MNFTVYLGEEAKKNGLPITGTHVSGSERFLKLQENRIFLGTYFFVRQ